jgi:rhodanese-related sulfurtransferase
MTQHITRQDVADRIERGEVTVVEALSPTHYAEAHLPGAINVPHDRVDELAETLLPDKDAAIVVYCADTTCANSGIAASRLVDLGYRNVFDYDAGKQDWIDAGLPTEEQSCDRPYQHSDAQPARRRTSRDRHLAARRRARRSRLRGSAPADHQGLWAVPGRHSHGHGGRAS